MFHKKMIGLKRCIVGLFGIIFFYQMISAIQRFASKDKIKLEYGKKYLGETEQDFKFNI